MKKQIRVNRLSKREEKANVKKAFYFSVISILIVVAFLMFGITALGRFADLLGTVFNNGSQNTIEESGDVAAPVFDNLPSATSSARIKVSGFSNSGEKILFFVNGSEQGETEVIDHQFKYEDLILKSGENKIEAKAVSGDKSSDFSSAHTIIYDNTPPKLEVETPNDGQSFSGNNRIKVSGKTDSDAQVFVNSFLASIGFDGSFEVFIPVSEGENKIEIRAVDSAGNEKKESRKINFSK